MSDGFFFFLAGLAAAAIISLALVWPQGLGAPSPFAFARPQAPHSLEAPASASAAALKGSL